MQAQLLKYTDKSFRSLGFNLFVATSDYSIESIHQLRLNIKKIRMLLKILNYKQSVKTDDKTVKEINEIFTNSGLLRDTQIQIQILKTFKNQAEEEYRILLPSLKTLQRREEKQLRKSITILNPFDIVLLNQRFVQELERHDDGTLLLMLGRKLDKLKREFFQLASENIHEDSLHRTRIILKEYINIHNLLRKGTINKQFDTNLLENTDKLQRRIGEWHDLKLLYDFMILRNFNTLYLFDIVKKHKEEIQSEIISELLNTLI